MDYQVIIPAAGTGNRMCSLINKQFIELIGKPVIVHTLLIFENDFLCKGIILVVNPDDRERMEKLIHEYQITKVISIVNGGMNRQQSVWNGLKCVEKAEIILIHDGARPFVKIPINHELVNIAAQQGAVVLAVPVKDTIKRVHDSQVIDTVERESLWAIQTPQAFHVSLIKEAHQLAIRDGYLGTDDASLVERIGHPVTIIRGDYHNIKLTTPEDLLFAKAILESWNEQST